MVCRLLKPRSLRAKGIMLDRHLAARKGWRLRPRALRQLGSPFSPLRTQRGTCSTSTVAATTLDQRTPSRPFGSSVGIWHCAPASEKLAHMDGNQTCRHPLNGTGWSWGREGACPGARRRVLGRVGQVNLGEAKERHLDPLHKRSLPKDASLDAMLRCVGLAFQQRAGS